MSADEECPVTAVHLKREPLDFTDGQCRVPSLTGRLTVSCQDGQEHVIPLFGGDPLIFKLRKNWAGEGRRTSGLTSGHFIVIAPATWERTGHAPVEPDNCTDSTFRAHYFHREPAAADEGADGFRESRNSLFATGIELTGRRIFDDSDDGELFVGDPPSLNSSQNIVWARVGEETENGWGQNFLPDRQSLSEILDSREGRFFLRVYDSEVSMLDSVAFRYLRNLRRILVNGVEYDQDMVLVPTSTGYPPTEVRLIGADGSTLAPNLPVGASQTTAPSGAIEVPAHPDADHISCTLGSDASGVRIVLDLPRVWWRMEDASTELGKWRDTPLFVTRQEFKKHGYSNATLSLLSKRFGSVRAGLDDELDQPYSRTIEDNRISIPLTHFVDYPQIDRRLHDDAHFNVEFAGETLPLILVSADPVPEILSFTAEPATIFGDHEAILEWATRNAGQARVAIDPVIGIVESHGTCAVRPTATTRYILSLSASDMNDVTSTVTVTVHSASALDGRPAALVWGGAQGWRRGKGFSWAELEDVGLTLREAAERSIPVDRRRRKSHPANVETIRRLLDA